MNTENLGYKPYKCSKCGWVHAALPVTAIAEVTEMYLRCVRCGASSGGFVPAAADDAPDGCTLQPVYVPGAWIIDMTTPYARTRSLVQTKDFLRRLTSLGDDAIPLSMLVEAEALLQHYPTLQEIETAHKSNPEIFGPVPPFQRDITNPEIQGILDAAAQGVSDDSH